MRRVLWSPRGLALYERDVAARRARGDIERTILMLAQRAIGRPGRISGTYEKNVIGQPYVIVYAFLPRDDGGEDDILVLRITYDS
ncbi:MAG: hypothetical protein ACREUF_10835 [Solimonas sp.]